MPTRPHAPWSRRALLTAAAATPLLAAPALAQADGMAGAGAAVMGRDAFARAAAIDRIVARGNPDMLATLIMAMRYAPGPDLDAAAAAITGATEPRGWFDWSLWQEGRPDIVPHPSYAPLKLALFERIDPEFLRFLRPEQITRDAMKIRLEEILWGGVRVDGIPSLDNPNRIAAGEADYLNDDDPVFGVAINGDARAYPLRVMGWHEMFNEVIGGVPLALAYCTLCGAGILFETQVDGRDTPFVFGSSGFLYRSNKLMFDRQTDSLWNQFTGQPVVGPLVGSGIALRQRPLVVTSWASWRAANPDTTVLSLETGHRRDYGAGVVYRDYFASPDLMFPALADSAQAARKDLIFGVRAPLGAKAWPLAAFSGGRVINDRAGATALVLIGDPGGAVRAYDRGAHRFSLDGDTVRDASGAAWRVTEDALVGPDGARAPRVAGHVAYWFAWNGYLGPQAELWSEG